MLYYAIYNPEYRARDKHEPFEVYRLVDGNYVRQQGEPVWMPEISLGIRRGQSTYEGWTREWLYWYNVERNRFPTPEEQAEQAQQQLDSLIAKLGERGIAPGTL